MNEFPSHLTLTIEHNNHKNTYSSIQQYLNDNDILKECILFEDLEICIRLDELWELRWYPSTPIGFHHIISYSLERCLELAKEIK